MTFDDLVNEIENAHNFFALSGLKTADVAAALKDEADKRKALEVRVSALEKAKQP